MQVGGGGGGPWVHRNERTIIYINSSVKGALFKIKFENE